jgi:predicted Zn-dependent protease
MPVTEETIAYEAEDRQRIMRNLEQDGQAVTEENIAAWFSVEQHTWLDPRFDPAAARRREAAAGAEAEAKLDVWRKEHPLTGERHVAELEEDENRYQAGMKKVGEKFRGSFSASELAEIWKILQREDEWWAKEGLAGARAYQHNGLPDKAKAALKLVVKNYPKTSAAKEAEEELRELRSGVKQTPELKSGVKQTPEDAAQQALSMARSYVEFGRPDWAKAELESLVKKFPKTRAAKEAEGELRKLK